MKAKHRKTTIGTAIRDTLLVSTSAILLMLAVQSIESVISNFDDHSVGIHVGDKIPQSLHDMSNAESILFKEIAVTVMLITIYIFPPKL